MGKSKKTSRVSDNITFEDENEDLRDEVDKFHDEKRQLKPGSYRRAKKAEADEVLNVEGDRSDEDVASSGDDSSDFDDDQEDAGISSNQWGRKRQDHYSTDYVDNDWGGMREEEMEEAELEEQDALARQKELDKAAAQLVDNFLDDDDDEDESISLRKKKKDQVEKETQLEWTFASVKDLNPETSDLTKEYNMRRDMYNVIVRPLNAVQAALPAKATLKKQILMIMDVYAKYLLDLAILLQQKTSSMEKKQHKDEMFESHPVQEEYLRGGKMIRHVDAFLTKNADVLSKLISRVEDGGLNMDEISLPEVRKQQKAGGGAQLADNMAEMGLGEEEEENGEETAGDGGKRKAPGAIAKNSKSAKKSKRKDRHAKVANRRKYKEIQKKVRSQVGKMRHETEKYTGEARGIRASTIKSIKLKA